MGLDLRWRWLSTVLAGMAKPRLAPAVPAEAAAVSIPMTLVAASTSGPPEFPGAMGASVWSRPWRVSGLEPVSSEAVMVRPVAEMMPWVTVGLPAQAEGVANRHYREPNGYGRRVAELHRRQATEPGDPQDGDVSRGVCADDAGGWLPWPGTTTVTVSAPCTTWLLVTTRPAALTTMPVPAPVPPPSRASTAVFTSTMAGSVAAATAATFIVVALVAA